MKTIYDRKEGDTVHPKRLLEPRVIKNWKYGRENTYSGGGLMTNASLRIAEINTKTPGQFWLRLGVGTNPETFIKVSAEEFSLNFD